MDDIELKVILKSIQLDIEYLKEKVCELEQRHIKDYSDTELNNELTRRQNEAEKRYEQMMAQGLV